MSYLSPIVRTSFFRWFGYPCLFLRVFQLILTFFCQVRAEKTKVSSMKTLRIALATLLIAFTSVFAISSANAGELNVLGGKLTWSDNMYKSDACSNYDFAYSNETGIELLILGFELNDPFGRKLTGWTEVGIKPNKSGTWNQQICKSAFTNGLGPYVIKLTVKDYVSTQRQATKEIYFLEIPGATPTPTPTVTVTRTPAPAPTVTVTATPAPIYIENPANKTLTDLVTKLNSQVKLLNAKVKKICAVKPKPKGC